MKKGELVVVSLSYMQIGIIFLVGVFFIAFSFLLGVNIGKRQAVSTAASLESCVIPPSTSVTAIEAETQLVTSVEITSLSEEKTPPLTFTKTLTDSKSLPAVIKEPAPVKEKMVKHEPPAAKASKHEAKPKVAAKKEEKPTKAAAKPAAKSEKYEKFTLQVASLSTREAAEKFSHEISKFGFTYVEEANLGKKGIHYRVFLGGYPTEAEAREAQKRLKAKNHIDSIVAQR